MGTPLEHPGKGMKEAKPVPSPVCSVSPVLKENEREHIDENQSIRQTDTIKCKPYVSDVPSDKNNNIPSLYSIHIMEPLK
jgi:hypothetical protein